MWTVIFLDSDFFCYAQNIHILTQSISVSTMCLEVSFCTVAWVIRKSLAPKVDKEGMEQESRGNTRFIA